MKKKRSREEGDNEEEEEEANKGLLWKLPQLRSKQLGKLGPAFGLGAGCGLGLGIGLLGGKLHISLSPDFMII